MLRDNRSSGRESHHDVVPSQGAAMSRQKLVLIGAGSTVFTQRLVADIILAVDEPLDATGCSGKENCMGEDGGRCMTHDLWASLNTKMIEHLNSISLKKLVGDQLAKGVSVEEHPVRRAISTQPVVKPIRITAPNSVFALGAAFSKQG